MISEISTFLMRLGTYNAISLDSKGRYWRLNSSLGALAVLSRHPFPPFPFVAITAAIDEYLASLPTENLQIVEPTKKPDR